MSRRGHCLALVAVLGVSMSACSRVGAIRYSLPPGISASFPSSQLATSEMYARTFCSVLSLEFATEGWTSCKDYVLMPTSYPPAQLDALPGGWTILRLGGFGAQCLAKVAETFKDAATHLETHGVASYHVPLGAFDSSEANARRIRNFVVDRGDLDKIILLAHSKGAADAMVALTTYSRDLERVKALITVAGAIGGSYLVDDLADLNENLLRKLSLPTCLPDRGRGGQNAIDSMRRKNRQEFLASREPLTLPSFSLSAVSTDKNTSRILMPLWRRVAPYAREQDSHIVEREAVVPGGAFLGRALGDHWAVAFPFDPNPKVKPAALKVINWNRFPRPALIEAAVRIAVSTVETNATSKRP